MLGTTRPNQKLIANTACHAYCGCEVASCCFECPLPVCKYDDITAYQAEEARLRRQRLVAEATLLRQQGYHARLIARLMNTTERTVFRYLAKQEGG